MLDPLGPRHLGNVDQALDPRLELDEGAVVREADHLPPHARFPRVFAFDVLPRIGASLLEAQGHPLLLRVELENHDLDLVPDHEHFRGVIDAAPRHVGLVQQAVDPAQVDEGPVLGDVLDGPLDHLALGEPVERAALLVGVLLLEHGLAREDDVAALAVHLDDPHLQLFALHRVEVAHWADIHERPRQEGAHPDVHGEAALDSLLDDPGDRLAVRVGPLDLLPDLHLLGLLLGEDDVSVLVLRLLQEHDDLVADADVRLAVGTLELFEVDDPLRLVAHVHDHLAAADAQDAAADELPFREGPQGLVVHVQQLLVLAVGELGVDAVHRPERFGAFGLGSGGHLVGIRVELSQGGIILHLLYIHAGRCLLGLFAAAGALPRGGPPACRRADARGRPVPLAVPRAAARSGQVLSPPHRLRQPRRDDHWLGHPCAGFRNDTDRPSSCQAEKLCFHRITTPPREELAALGQRPIEGLEQALVLAARANGEADGM